ncbi:hypothetical protein D3C71_50730 [compost metagenome]
MFLNIAAAVLAVFAALRLKDLAGEKQAETGTKITETAGAVTPATKDSLSSGSVTSDAVINKQVVPVDLTTNQMRAVIASGIKTPNTTLLSSNLVVSTAKAQKLF